MSGRSPALGAYLLASRLAEPVARPILRQRVRRGKEDPERLPERLGHAALPRPAGRLVWLHGASVGEATSMLPLIAALRARLDVAVLVTTGTLSSARRMAEMLPDGAVHQFVPVDALGPVGRFLDHWRPDVAVWVESELWPRLLVETARRRIPMALVNARLSERSFRAWRRVPGMARRLLGSFRTILTQDDESVQRLRALGAQARFGGNLKALVAAPDCDPTELAATRTTLGDRPVWLAASTHEGEDAAVAAAQATLCRGADRPLLILAPRHPERGERIAAILREAGLSVSRRSICKRMAPESDVWLADTLGEMGLWYRLSAVAFVGGSLVPRGGHTPFEPVQLGPVLVHGPHVENFAPAYAALDAAAAAVEVRDAGTLARAVGHLLSDRRERWALRDRARAVHEELKPDVSGMAATLLGLMEGA